MPLWSLDVFCSSCFVARHLCSAWQMYTEKPSSVETFIFASSGKPSITKTLRLPIRHFQLMKVNENWKIEANFNLKRVDWFIVFFLKTFNEIIPREDMGKCHMERYFCVISKKVSWESHPIIRFPNTNYLIFIFTHSLVRFFSSSASSSSSLSAAARFDPFFSTFVYVIRKGKDLKLTICRRSIAVVTIRFKCSGRNITKKNAGR